MTNLHNVLSHYWHTAGMPADTILMSFVYNVFTMIVGVRGNWIVKFMLTLIVYTYGDMIDYRVLHLYVFCFVFIYPLVRRGVFHMLFTLQSFIIINFTSRLLFLQYDRAISNVFMFLILYFFMQDFVWSLPRGSASATTPCGVNITTQRACRS